VFEKCPTLLKLRFPLKIAIKSFTWKFLTVITIQIFHDIFNLINIFFKDIGKGSLLDKFKEEVQLSSKHTVNFDDPTLRIYWIGKLIMNFWHIKKEF